MSLQGLLENIVGAGVLQALELQTLELQTLRLAIYILEPGGSPGAFEAKLPNNRMRPKKEYLTLIGLPRLLFHLSGRGPRLGLRIHASPTGHSS